jgi:single-strand DNA-binding protein
MNRVTLAGHLGRDPEIRATPSGRMVATFSVATNRRYKSEDGQTQEQTQWHRIVAFGRPAELSRDYLKKGRAVLLEGRLQTREWEDKEGRKRETTEIVMENLWFLPGGERGDASGLASAGSGPREAEIPF